MTQLLLNDVAVDRRAQWSQWMTPEWAATLIVERYFADLSSHDLVLEPSCGLGSFLKAIPPHVPAVGVEIDAELAAIARRNSGRSVHVGDFRTLALAERPTTIIGNPPYKVKVVHGFLQRAAELLPDEGRCGLLLPAYAMQTHRTVMRWHQTWSLHAELMPRRLFPRLRLPLLFVTFRKSKVRTMAGFALYQEAVEVENLPTESKEQFAQGSPRTGVWRSVVQWAMHRMGGEATLQDLYRVIEPKRPTANAFWQEKVRQVVQECCEPVSRGRWRLAA